ncbi:(Fe-S)-binding protein [Corynebacterium sp. sy017]|uniref:(Fe-S)-binding protein n=1 Tax=unclassified Corynebacterium TaxID=2624378 RepID=UPI0011859F77|nr:(Fe-S)-binding protein [Corynebacterium sp. SY003]MBP3088407.1 (Fe-S)-binding protein [Corynebacterium sp. sy017]TSD92084.1 (Fe-S)-binding protein [Corynebacterium sp. SY003]
MVVPSPTQLSPSAILGIIAVIISIPAWCYFFFAGAKIYRLIRSGTATTPRTNQPVRRLATMLRKVFFHTELARKPLVAAAHWLVMIGFIGGSLVLFEAYIQVFAPHSGWWLLHEWPVYHFCEELLAVGTIVGIGCLMVIRATSPARFYGSNSRAAVFVELVVLIEGLGMLLVKAAKIATYGGGSVWADFLSRYIALLLPASATLVSVFALIKLLSAMIWLGAVAHYINWGVAWHRFLAFFNIFFRRNPDGSPALGALTPMLWKGKALTLDTLAELDEGTLDKDNKDNADKANHVEPTEPTLGTGTLADGSWKMLLDATTCTECGRCQEQCPAWNTQKPLSPKLLMTDIRDAATTNTHANVDVLKLVGESAIINPDALWSCTHCGACVEQCPVDIEHIDHVANLRRFQVLAESEFPSELAGLFKNLEVKGNPWGRNNTQRADWISKARRDGIEVPVFGEDIHDFSDTEYLFWVGCAGAFDDAAQRTTRAIVELLHTAGVKFAVLSRGETCTGDPARRAGNEFLFQQLAKENISTLNEVFEGVVPGQRKIITSCPHCFNTLRNEYPDFDGHFDVFHHTQLLNRLVRDNRLTPIPRSPHNRAPITYHDPCFLGRHNKVFDPPRELLGVTGAELVEMDRTRNEGFCCGAGGARMFMEEKLGTRINENRAQEAVATGAAEIAVGCPFCNTMLTGGVKTVAAQAETAPAVRDVALMLRDSILIDDKLPDPQAKTFLETPRRTPRKTTQVSAQATAKEQKTPSAKTHKAPTVAPPANSGDVPVPPAPVPPVVPVIPTPTTPPVPTAPIHPVVPPAPGASSVPVPPVATPPVPTAPAQPAVPQPPTPSVPIPPGSALPPGITPQQDTQPQAKEE